MTVPHTAAQYITALHTKMNAALHKANLLHMHCAEMSKKCVATATTTKIVIVQYSTQPRGCGATARVRRHHDGAGLRKADAASTALTLLYSTALRDGPRWTAQSNDKRCAMQCSTALHGAALRSTVQGSAALHATAKINKFLAATVRCSTAARLREATVTYTVAQDLF
jgi:hypothetical protein